MGDKAQPDFMSCDRTANRYRAREIERAVGEEEQQKAKSRGTGMRDTFIWGRRGAKSVTLLEGS